LGFGLAAWRLLGKFCAKLPSGGTKKSPAPSLEGTGLITGDGLLSQDLSSHYHRRKRVSLPGSEWDRVVPLC
jgi:hypothetical protein